MWLSPRLRFATIGVMPSGALSTTTCAAVGALEIPTSCFVPCMIVAHADTAIRLMRAATRRIDTLLWRIRLRAGRVHLRVQEVRRPLFSLSRQGGWALRQARAS